MTIHAAITRATTRHGDGRKVTHPYQVWTTSPGNPADVVACARPSLVVDIARTRFGEFELTGPVEQAGRHVLIRWVGGQQHLPDFLREAGLEMWLDRGIIEQRIQQFPPVLLVGHLAGL